MSDRLDIAWIDAWRRLRQMVGPVKGGQGKGEFILPDDMIRFGRLLYGFPTIETRKGREVESYSPAEHLASDLRDREAAKRFIKIVDVFLSECEAIIAHETLKHTPAGKKPKTAKEPQAA